MVYTKIKLGNLIGKHYCFSLKSCTIFYLIQHIFFRRARHIGCPNQVKLGRSASGKDFLIVASKRNAIASINVNSGDIDWRHIQEINGNIAPVFNIYNPLEKSIPCKFCVENVLNK